MEGKHRAFLGILFGDFLNSAQGTERPAMSAVPFFHGLTVAEAVYRRLLIQKALLLLSVGLPVANAPDVLQPCGLLYYP